MKILLILITALILRLINLNQSLWLDEAINVVNSQKYNFSDFLTVYSIGDFHPPLYFAVLWIWTHIFGTAEIVVRIPSVISGVLTVWLTYLIGKKLFNEKIGLVAGLILAFNPLHIYYSQEARMYALAALIVVVSFWSLLNLIKGRRYFVFIYGVSVALVLYADYPIYFVLPAQLVYVMWVERKKLLTVIMGIIMGVILWLPWLKILPSQLKTGQGAASQIPGWANVVGGANSKELILLWVKSIIGRVSFDNKWIYGLIVVVVSSVYGFILFKAIKSLKEEIKFLLLWIVVPVSLIFLVSFYIPVFAYFRMLYILPAISLILAYGISNTKYQKVFIGLITIFSLCFLLMYYLNPKFQREDWRGAVNYALTDNPEDSRWIFFEDSNIPAPFEYYFNCTKRCLMNSPALKNFPARNEADLFDFDYLTPYPYKIYLFDYLVEISDPNRLVKKKLENLGYKNTETRDFPGVGFVYEYSK